MAQPFPTGKKPATGRVADWVELQALSRRVAYKRGDLKSAIAIEDVDSPDLLEENVWEELRLRSSLFDHRWPLRLRGSWLTRRSPSPVDLAYYRYLLLLGLGEIETEDRQLFELLVADSLRGLTHHHSLHLGHPASPGMDPSFRERVKVYTAAAGLINSHEVLADPLPTDKDLGLDAVSWMPFEDTRSGVIHIVAQCATGDDWYGKLDDLHLGVWGRHIAWAVPPIRVLSVPFSLTMLPERWVRVCTKAGLILDRPRLLELHRRKPIASHLSVAVKGRLKHLAA